jgi:hypothetical protein
LESQRVDGIKIVNCWNEKRNLYTLSISRYKKVVRQSPFQEISKKLENVSALGITAGKPERSKVGLGSEREAKGYDVFVPPIFLIQCV